MAGQRAAGVPQSHTHTRHIQKVQRAGNAGVQFLKGFQPGLGQRLCLFPCFCVKTQLFCLQSIMALLGILDVVQLLPGLLPKSDHILHRAAILALQPIQEIQPLLYLIQFCIIGVVGIQPPDQICGHILGVIV